MKEEGNLTDFENRISLVDVLNGLNKLPDNSIDLVFADPPYNIGKKFGEGKENGDKMAKEEYIEWCKKWIDECMRVLKPTGTFYFMGATQFINYLDSYVSNKYSVISRIVWYYDSSGVQAKKYFGSLYEPIIMVVKDKNNYKFNAENVMVEAKTGSKRKLIDYRKTPPQPYNNKKVMGNVWNIPRVRFRMDEYENHPTQKPEELLRRIILSCTDPGEDQTHHQTPGHCVDDGLIWINDKNNYDLYDFSCGHTICRNHLRLFLFYDHSNSIHLLLYQDAIDDWSL
mgnify:CR=1 FL=1